MSKLSITVHSDMQVWRLTWLVTDIQQEIIWNFFNIQKYHNIIFHCTDSNAEITMPWKAHRSQCERETPHVLLPTVARTVGAGMLSQGRVSQCVFCRSLSSKPFASIQPVVPYHTILRFIIFRVGIGWSILQQFIISKLCSSKKKKKKRAPGLLTTSCKKAEGGWCCVCALCDIPKGAIPELEERRERSKPKEGCSWLTALRLIFIRNTNLTFSKRCSGSSCCVEIWNVSLFFIFLCFFPYIYIFIMLCSRM